LRRQLPLAPDALAADLPHRSILVGLWRKRLRRAPSVRAVGYPRGSLHVPPGAAAVRRAAHRARRRRLPALLGPVPAARAPVSLLRPGNIRSNLDPLLLLHAAALTPPRRRWARFVAHRPGAHEPSALLRRRRRARARLSHRVVRSQGPSLGPGRPHRAEHREPAVARRDRPG